MKSTFVMFNIFDLLNFHLNFIGHTLPLLLRGLYVAVTCTNPARSMPGTSQQQDPGTTRALWTAMDKGFSHHGSLALSQRRRRPGGHTRSQS